MSQQNDWSNYYAIWIEKYKTEQRLSKLASDLMSDFVRLAGLVTTFIFVYNGKLDQKGLLISLSFIFLPYTVQEIFNGIIRVRDASKIKEEDVSETREKNS